MINNISKALMIAERYDLISPMNLQEDLQSNNHWRSDMSIISDKTFENMLYINHYNKDIFSHAVQYAPKGEIIEKYKKKATESTWFTVYQQAVSLLNDSSFQDDYKQDLNHSLRPFIRYSRKIIEQFLTENKQVSLDLQVLDQLLTQLEQALMEIAHKSLVLELNLSRENGLLVGDTSEERFLSFVRKFDNKEFLNEFYNKYIVLTRLLSTTTLFFTNNTQKMLSRIYEDQRAITETFKIREFIITNIKLGEGDTHQQGNTVSIITFTDNNKIVYKPKRLQINLAFNHLIDWLNTNSNLDLRTVKSVIYNDYTYEEYITYKPCNSLKEVTNYYQRFGQLMAVIQLLNGTDIHMENMISYGEYPVIIDLETLIQQPMPLEKQSSHLIKEMTDTIFHHVTRTLFLPTNGVKIEDPLKIDLSALNGRKKKFDFKVLQPVNKGTDQLKYDYQNFELEGANNLPFIEDENLIIDYKEYREHIIQGFREVCEIFLQNKEDIIKEGSILYQFKGVYTRCLFRDTSQYANILMHMQHPEMLMDMLDREKAIENMWAFPYTDKHLNQAEVIDMMRNDIPIFFSKTDQTSIITSDNNEIGNFYLTSSFDYLISSISKLTRAEIDKQISIIHLHFGNFSDYRRYENKLLKQNIDTIENSSIIQLDFLKEAENIADDIMQRAFKGEITSWIIPFESDPDVWSLIPLKEDFYNGIGGIYLLFHFLSQEIQKEKYTNFANQILEQYTTEQMSSYELGLSGYPGLFYAFSLVDDYGTNKLKITKMINKYIEQFEKVIDQDIDEKLQIDYLNGFTGLINALLRFYWKRKDSKFIQLAMKLANHLIEKLSQYDQLDRGFAHGITSYALTLFKIGEVTKLQQYVEKATDLMKFATKHIDATYHAMSWCHGFIGEGIARIKMEPWLNSLDDTIIQADIINKAKDSNLLANDCMCHGNMGITELFLTHYNQTKEHESIELARIIASQVVNLKQAHNNKYKLMDIAEYPDITLFTGLSGIAYQLLRIANPEKVPSILTI